MNATPHLSAAIEELAAQARNRDGIVTTAEAKDHVDARLIAEWLGLELLKSNAPALLSEIIGDRLNEDDARTVMCSLAIGYEAKVQSLLQAALVDHIAADLCYDAQRLVDDGPTDRQVYDDHGDWLHERRKQDRLDEMYAAGAL